MPQLDTNLFLNSLSSIIIFLLLFYLYLIIYAIPKLFKLLITRKFIGLFYKRKVIKSTFDLRYTRKSIYFFFTKIIKLR
jgi:hypothetical protein